MKMLHDFFVVRSAKRANPYKPFKPRIRSSKYVYEASSEEEPEIVQTNSDLGLRVWGFRWTL